MKSKYFSSIEEERVYDCIVNWKITKATTPSSISRYLDMPINEVLKHVKNLEDTGLLTEDFC